MIEYLSPTFIDNISRDWFLDNFKKLSMPCVLRLYERLRIWVDSDEINNRHNQDDMLEVHQFLAEYLAFAVCASNGCFGYEKDEPIDVDMSSYDSYHEKWLEHNSKVITFRQPKKLSSVHV